MLDANCSQYFQPMQIWYYPYIEGDLGRDVRLLFYRPRGHQWYRLWDPFTEGVAALASDDISATRERWAPQDVLGGCKDGEAILGAMAVMQNDREKIHSVFRPPPANEEDVGRILRSTVLADPKAPKLTAEMTVAYPSGEGI